MKKVILILFFITSFSQLSACANAPEHSSPHSSDTPYDTLLKNPNIENSSLELQKRRAKLEMEGKIKPI